MRHILIIGATSAIASATARRFAKDGDQFYLVARNPARLDAVGADLKVRGAAQVITRVMDLNNTAEHSGLIAEAGKALGRIDILLIAHGTLSNQAICEASFENCLKEFQTNCLSILSLLTHAANVFEAQRFGTISVISSTAGDRGRQSNYVYGTAKAAVSTFLQGLRNRLDGAGVHVLTIKPGFVDTPMTAEFKKGLLWASADKVGKGVYRGICKKKDVVYSPLFWRWIMMAIKMIPEFAFKKMKL